MSREETLTNAVEKEVGMSDISFDQAKDDTRETIQILGRSRTLSAVAIALGNTILAGVILRSGFNQPVISAISLGIAWGVLSTGLPLALYLQKITQP